MDSPITAVPLVVILIVGRTDLTEGHQTYLPMLESSLAPSIYVTRVNQAAPQIAPMACTLGANPSVGITRVPRTRMAARMKKTNKKAKLPPVILLPASRWASRP